MALALILLPLQETEIVELLESTMSHTNVWLGLGLVHALNTDLSSDGECRIVSDPVWM